MGGVWLDCLRFGLRFLKLFWLLLAVAGCDVIVAIVCLICLWYGVGCCSWCGMFSVLGLVVLW